MTAPLLQNKLEAQPLYAKVGALLIDRLISGEWKPGQAIPSEFAIAAELGVSQGTVRKALDDMTAQGLVVRKQGRGTFVAEAEDQSILFRFYRLTPNSAPDSASEDETGFPQSEYVSRTQARANEQEKQVLNLTDGDQVWRFERLRYNGEQPILFEKLVLPCPVFPGLDENTRLPNNVYQFYSEHYGIIVATVKEELRAIIAPDSVALLLDLPSNSPLLEIDRRAVALDGRIVEWRVSLCRSDTMHYRNVLS